MNEQEYKKQMVIKFEYEAYESLLILFNRQYNLACRMYYLFKLDSMDQQLFYSHADIQRVILGFLVGLEQNDFLERYLEKRKNQFY